MNLNELSKENPMDYKVGDIVVYVGCIEGECRHRNYPELLQNCKGNSVDYWLERNAEVIAFPLPYDVRVRFAGEHNPLTAWKDHFRKVQ